MSSRKQVLLDLQAELRERIGKIDIDLHSRSRTNKSSENVTEHQNDDVLFNLKNEALNELEQIEHALLKVESQQYGKCEKCHELISEQRLDAVPFASLCKHCAV